MTMVPRLCHDKNVREVLSVEKRVALILVLSMLLTLVGAATIQAAPSKGTIVFIPKSTSATFYLFLVKGAKDRAKELGYPVDLLLDYVAAFVNGQLTDAGYNKYLAGEGRVPTTRLSDSAYFPTFTDLKTGWTAEKQALDHWSLTDAEYGWEYILITSVAMTASKPNGTAAWSVIANEILPSTRLNDNPKWAILPRVAASASRSTGGRMSGRWK
jgi:hypothetical protein